MAGLFLVHESDPSFADAAMAEARAQFARHGFPAGSEHSLGGWRLLHAPHIIGGPETLLVEGEDLVAVAGTLVFDGLTGSAALRLLLREAELPSPDWSRIRGQFAVLVRRSGRTFLLTDYFAAFQLFRDLEARLFSTSFLAAANALPSLSFDPQGVYEFAFNVVPIGDDTVLSDLKLVGPDEVAELTAEGARFHPVAKPLPEEVVEMPVGERVARHRERLSAAIGAHTGLFRQGVACPLSGGLDSRLLLAALRAEGAEPRVYVYGGPDEDDVEIARRIGEAEGFDVEIFDKEAWPHPEPDAFAEQVERNFQDYDGLPVYGELFENGANALARDRRHPGGALAASGGCGEIYRNFFFLPDRPTSASAVARIFFARFDRGDVTGAFDEREFVRAIEDKILASLGCPGERGPLPRPLIEQIYPRVRCRSFFGREISLEARYGPYLMPFLDREAVAEAMTLPMHLKNAGRFEAILLAATDPGLARHQSAYGHDFAGPPGRRHRFSEWSTRIRPAGLRQKSYAIQRRLRRVPHGRDPLLGRDYLGRVIDLGYPAMRRFFRIDRIADDGLLMRIACLEYLAARLGSRLSA